MTSKVIRGFHKSSAQWVDLTSPSNSDEVSEEFIKLSYRAQGGYAWTLLDIDDQSTIVYISDFSVFDLVSKVGSADEQHTEA